MAEVNLDEFTSRVEADYAEFLKKVKSMDTDTLIEQAWLIAHMKMVYEKLRDPLNFPIEEISYLTQAEHPLDVVYGHFESMNSKDISETLELAVYTIWDHEALYDPDQAEHAAQESRNQSKDSEKISKANFVRKSSSILDLKLHGYNDGSDRFIVEKVIALSPPMYRIFTDHLTYPYHFIRENNNLAFDLEDRIWHCALIREAGESAKDGILIAPEGYEYARYCAYVHDCSELDLNNTPVVDHGSHFVHEEISDIKALISDGAAALSPVAIQKLICGIGEILDSNPNKDELPNQFYLYNNTTNSFAGFCAYTANTVDGSGEPLHVGDVVAESACSTDIQIIWHDRGHTIPSQDYIESHNLKKIYSWYGTNGITAARSLNFDVLSCKTDYKTMKRIIQQAVRQIQQKDSLPRDR